MEGQCRRIAPRSGNAVNGDFVSGAGHFSASLPAAVSLIRLTSTILPAASTLRGSAVQIGYWKAA
jgi:hypothetical protein